MNLKKLPKWAQAYIKKLEGQRFVAVRALNEFQDNQTPSKFFIEKWECTGESGGPTKKRAFIQTDRISVSPAPGEEIELSFDNHDRLILRCTTGRLVIGPQSSNTVEVISV